MQGLRKKELDFLTSEISYWLDEGIITSEQSEEILSLYEVKKHNLRTILFTAGAVLLGLGGVSFIAANWHTLPKMLRVCVIVCAYIASLTAYSFTGTQTRTGRSFLFLASVIFGSGIFLITRMYDIKLSFSEILGWWVIEILIASGLTRDLWQIYLSQVISLLYLNAINAVDIFALQFMNTPRLPLVWFFSPINAFALVTALWGVWYLVRDRAAFSVNMLITLLLMASRLDLCLGGTWALVILAASGGILSLLPVNNDAQIFGLLMLGMFGLLLTWPEFIRGPSYWSIVSAVSTACLMLVNIYRGHTTTGIIFCVMLASRYFFDNLFGYLPKAWGFTLMGIVLVILGLFFEKVRKFF